jgi:hypothetical protein
MEGPIHQIFWQNHALSKPVEFHGCGIQSLRAVPSLLLCSVAFSIAVGPQ